jgi:dTDP-4-amino-4,6-dideoxygalactose transaminase
MKIPFVDLKAQYISIKNEIHDAIENVISNTAFINGEHVSSFETNFSKQIGANHCIGVGNGTDALVICLKALGVGTGDEVITVANSFIATSEAITSVGAKVIFVDCDATSFNIDVSKIVAKITSKTKVIIPVHLYGQPADLSPILEIASKHGIKIIEDCAQAHLAEYRTRDGWKMAGTMGDLATFSFFPGKNLGAYGDAGAIVTNNSELAKKTKMLANHGRIAKYDHEIEGYNSRLDGIQAAILNVKLKYLKQWTESRRQLALKYSELLKDVAEINCPKFDKGKTNPVWHLYVIRTNKRDQLQKYLNELGIAASIHYPIALPNLKAYSYLHHVPTDFPISSKYQGEILSLPLFPELTQEQMEYIVNSIKKFFLN